MAFKDLKCYQEIMRTLPEHESNLLIAMTRSITRGLRMLPPFASSTTSSHTDEATAVTNTAPTDTLRISNPDEPVRASSFEDEPPATLPEGITRMQHLASDAATRFQHEFKIEGDGATAKTLHTFLTAHLPSRLSVTVVEWLAMQNPTRAFTPARPQLPGQHHPGLGLGRTVTKMLVAISREKGRDCLLSIPEYFHNAVAYKAAGWFFVNPAFEGYMRALLIDLGADLETKGLSAVSWAFQNCHVVDANGVVEVWQAQEQILSVSNRMKSYLASSEYVRLVTKFTKRYAGKLHIDWSSAKELDKYLLPGAAPAYQAEE
ncbi:hypothetical protein BC830DRAFT_1149061 [Chytriomyces sp. MP71]|nr:hypothetical protein BC830DRAFT_1149061 [Chytriomyces sp. MP71]